jgi:hypothetical protein
MLAIDHRMPCGGYHSHVSHANRLQFPGSPRSSPVDIGFALWGSGNGRYGSEFFKLLQKSLALFVGDLDGLGSLVRHEDLLYWVLR